MGYGGGTFSGTLNVDIVQTDVQAIVDGICGGSSQTISDLNYHLASIDSALYSDNSAAWSLSYINAAINNLHDLLYSWDFGESAIQVLRAIRDDLFDAYSNRSAAQILVSMEGMLNDIRNNTAPP